MSSGELLIAMTITMAPISVGQTKSSQDDVDQIRASFGFTNILQQKQPQSQIPSQAYSNCAIDHAQVCFSFRI